MVSTERVANTAFAMAAEVANVTSAAAATDVADAAAGEVNRSRRRFTVTAAGVALLVCPSLRAQTRLEKSKVTIAVSAKTSFYQLPLTLADQLGFFRAEGLDIELNDFAGGPGALQAMQSGAADLVSGAYENTISLQSKNQFCQAFVLMGRAPQIVVGVSTKTMPNFAALADLKGKKIGVSMLGSSTNRVVSLLWARAGLNPQDVTFVGVGTSGAALAAVRSGQIDAISNIDPIMTMLEKSGEVKIIADTRTLMGTQAVFGGPMAACCLFAPAEFLQKNPSTAQALANAVVRSLKWLQTAGPSDIIRTVPEAYLLGDRGLYLSAFNKVREALALDGLISEEATKTALRVLTLLEPAVKPEKIALARTYTNEFARRAKDRFKA